MSSIAPCVKECISLFTRCTDVLQQPDQSNDFAVSNHQLVDSLGRFRIWAGNIGATQGAEVKSSLEYRLREAPKVASQISEILNDLLESLEDGKGYCL